MSRRIHLAVFDRQDQLLAAARECREKKLELCNAYTPYPIHELDEVLGIRRTRLPWICLIGGVAGLGLGLWFQYWASSVDWPINVGGKPWNSLPAFMPVAFELMVLFAGLSTAVGLWLCSGLLPGRKPKRSMPRVTDDRFGLVVAGRDATLDPEEIRGILQSHGAAECWEEWED